MPVLQKEEQRIKILVEAHFWKILSVVIILAVVSLFRGDYSLSEYLQMQNRIEQSRERIADLEAFSEELEVERKRLAEDERYIEKIAREKYKMIRKGEKVIRVIPKDGSGKE